MDDGGRQQGVYTSLSPQNDESDPTQSLVALYNRLDSMWIKYLDYLDTYTTSQKVLQAHLSSGYISLARANFTSRIGRRFGRDHYHDGAIATRRVSINENQESALRVKTSTWSGPSDKEVDVNKVVATHLPSPATTPECARNDANEKSDKPLETGSRTEPDGLVENSSDIGSNAESEEDFKKPALECDPIRWFGVLVPRELRDAQSSFCDAFDHALDGAVNGARGMRDTEVEIRRLRKDLRKAERELER